MLKWVEDPALGGPNWFGRKGKFMTLATLFLHFRETFTAFEIFTFYLRCPKLAHVKAHGTSNAKSTNAKNLRMKETGRWGHNDGVARAFYAQRGQSSQSWQRGNNWWQQDNWWRGW